jgi:putative Mn2+ efflux pump MntP
MGFIELALIATGVSMDAFAVALCTGVSIKKASAKNIFTVGLYFGIFQAVMPLIGYYLGAQFADKITPAIIVIVSFAFANRKQDD